jgi:uncharacterized protein involved in outer membrane biogenesis
MKLRAPWLTQNRGATWVAVAIVGVVAATLGAGEASGWPFLSGALRNALQRATGVPVQLDGRFRAHLLWRPHLQVEHLMVGSAAGMPAPYLVDGQKVALGWRWADLWRFRQGNTLTLRSLQADKLDVHLVRLADGRANWQLGSARPATQEKAKASALPGIDRLEISDGRVVIDDAVLETRLHVDVRGREGGAADAQAANGYRAAISGSYRGLPLDLAVRSGGALPLLRDDADGDEDPVATTPLRVEGEVGASRIVFDGQAAALPGARHLDGALRLSGPSLAHVGEVLGLTLPQTPAFDLLGRVVHHDGVWGLRAERLAIGRSELAGDFRFDTRPKPSRLSGELHGPRLMLADLGPSIGAPTGGAADSPRAAASAPARDHVLPQQRFNLPSLRAMDANLQVAIDQLVFATSAMTPLQGLRTHVRLDGGVLELQGLEADVAGGHLSGFTRLDARAQPARWNAQLRFGGVDVAGWLRGLRTPEGRREAPLPTQTRALRQQREAARQHGERAPAYLTGVLDATVDVTGSGESTAQILATLDGPVQVTVRDGTMSHVETEALGLDLAQALGVVVKGDDALPLRCARLDFVTRNGVMQLTRGVLDNPDSTIRVRGEIDLRSERLALAMRARPKDISPVSLRSPVTVTGTLSSPSVSIEPSRLTARALGAAALGAVAGPLAALLPLIDLGEREQGNPCAAQATTAEPNPSRTAATKGEVPKR